MVSIEVAEIPLRPRRWRRHIVALLCWGYFAAIVALILALRQWGDRNWRFTVLLFSPRWLFLLPLPILTLMAALIRRRNLWVCLASAIVAVAGLLGFHFSIARYTSYAHPALRIVAFNAHLDALDYEGWRGWIASVHPDVVTLEEAESGLTPEVLGLSGWHIAQVRELCVLSRFEVSNVKYLGDDAALRCTIEAPSGPVDLVAVHLASPHRALREAVKQEPRGPDALSFNAVLRDLQAQMLRAVTAGYKGNLVLAGDFNLVSDSPVFRENFSSLHDAFDEAGIGFGLTYYNRWTMLRIDHILTSDRFITSNCSVGPWLGSPHRPLVADLFAR